MSSSPPTASKPAITHLRVRYGSSALGQGVFWHGPVERVEDINNLQARNLAKEAIAQGRSCKSGMWRAEPLAEDGQIVGQGGVDKLIAFVNKNARGVRPGRPVPSPYAGFANLDDDLAQEEGVDPTVPPPHK